MVMLFTPIIKRKKDINKKNGQPFPDGSVVKGIFTGISVEVYSSTGIKILYENGFYGKGSRSKGPPNVTKDTIDGNECLTLGLEESYFLSYYLRVLIIHDWKGNEIQWQQFITSAKKINSNFLECLAAYLYLKAKGWVIKDGIKFGGNFLIYKKGPRFNHASFIIFVRPTHEAKYIATIDLKGIQRIAETSDKDILLLEISKPNVITLNTIFDIREFRVSETIIRRFNSTSYVQNYKLK